MFFPNQEWESTPQQTKQIKNGNLIKPQQKIAIEIATLHLVTKWSCSLGDNSYRIHGIGIFTIIYLHWSHKNSANVGKYTPYKDPTGKKGNKFDLPARCATCYWSILDLK